MLGLVTLFAVSVIAIFLIALLTQWLFPYAKSEPIDIAEFEQQLSGHGHDNHVLQIVVSKSGKEAIAKLDNNELAFLRRLSEKYSLRIVNPEQIKLTQKADLTIISIGDFTWPSLAFENQQWQLAKNWLDLEKEKPHA